MNEVKNLIICSETTSAEVVVSYEGWWHQPPSFALMGTENQGLSFHLPEDVSCFKTDFSNTNLAVRPKCCWHCTNNSVIKQV